MRLAAPSAVSPARRQERHHHHGGVGQHRDRHGARGQPVQAVGQVDGVGATCDDQEQQHVVGRAQVQPDVEQRQVDVGGQVLVVRHIAERRGHTQQRQHLPAPRQAQRAAVGQLEPVVDEADRGAGDGHAGNRQPRRRALCQHGKRDQRAGKQDQTAHRGCALLGHVAGGTLLADLLAERVAAYEGDERGSRRDREQHRDHAREQHQLHGAIASTASSSPTDRLALTSTASPGWIISPSTSRSSATVANHLPP